MTTQDNIFDFNTRHNLQKQQAQCYHCLHILLVSVCAGSLRVYTYSGFLPQCKDMQLVGLG